MSADPTLRREIPDATVARLPEYLRTLSRLAEEGILSVSSEELAAAVGVRSAQLRKDLSHLGSYGVRGVGYEVETLALEISRALGLTEDWPVAIVGMGNLGHALASYSGFVTKGFRIVALFDDDPALRGEVVQGVEIQPFGHLRRRYAEEPIAIVEQILQGTGTDVEVDLDRGSAIEAAIADAGAGDVVLIAGKGHEQGQEVAGEIHPFDDRDVARAALARLRAKG